MQFESKYSMGQTVWAVRRATFKRLVNCHPCDATGKVKIGDEEFVCPKCGGSSAYPQSAGEKCYVDISSPIGKIDIEFIEPETAEKFGDPSLSVKYMLYATGVGSGQVWKESELFPSEEDAQRYCDEQNGLLPQDEPGAEILPQLIATRNSYEFAGKQ